jgi:hypothetical protein
MTTPTRGEIEEEARKQYVSDVASATGQEPTNPELDELKETGYYNRARRTLMSTGHAEEETPGAKRVESEEYHREVNFNRKGPSRFARIKGRVVPVRNVVLQQKSRAIGSVKSSRAVGSIRSSFREYKAAKQAEERQKVKDAAEIRAMRRQEAQLGIEAFKRGRQAGIKQTAYYSGYHTGKAYIQNPPKRREPLTFGGVLQLEKGHLEQTSFIAKDFDITGGYSGGSLLGSLGNESEFNYVRGPAPARKKKQQGNAMGLWL